MSAQLTCACGDRRFRVRLERDEQVALLTCSREGHHSLLLDSREFWGDVIQDGRPRERRCGCGTREFEVELEYQFRDDRSVRDVDVALRCSACGKHKIAATFEVTNDSTDSLLTTPLDPCADPWLVPKHTDLSETARSLVLKPSLPEVGLLVPTL